MAYLTGKAAVLDLITKNLPEKMTFSVNLFATRAVVTTTEKKLSQKNDALKTKMHTALKLSEDVFSNAVHNDCSGPATLRYYLDSDAATHLAERINFRLSASRKSNFLVESARPPLPKSD